jgi:hypothetical protein
MTESNPTDLAATRRALHGVAELLLAGPQHRTGGRIRLRITPGGFGTVAAPELRVDGEDLVAGGTRVPMGGRSYTELAEAVGVEAGAPVDVYSDGSGVDPGETVTLDPGAVRTIVAAYELGDAALREFAPDTGPVLWPEHLDVAITLDEVNYGVSPGDAYLAEPYAYVGPHHPRRGAFWNAPFGATRPVSALVDVAGAVRFFREGRDRARD